ncbi:MAG: tetratricopeptide repeat protein [Armatimonadetes bacterium]|nr:tetratricopeptide repeat protein [Armatimonadota bacterium]MDI9587115.1 tetratricopeptide repeat protein [Acidobacteriota bacterium]
MTRRCWFIALITIGCFQVSFPALAQDKAPAPLKRQATSLGRIVGLVVDAESLEPVANARVTVCVNDTRAPEAQKARPMSACSDTRGGYEVWAPLGQSRSELDTDRLFDTSAAGALTGLFSGGLKKDTKIVMFGGVALSVTAEGRRPFTGWVDFQAMNADVFCAAPYTILLAREGSPRASRLSSAVDLVELKPLALPDIVKPEESSKLDLQITTRLHPCLGTVNRIGINAQYVFGVWRNSAGNLLDDGKHGDGEKLDGVYGGQVALAALKSTDMDVLRLQPEIPGGWQVRTPQWHVPVVSDPAAATAAAKLVAIAEASLEPASDPGEADARMLPLWREALALRPESPLAICQTAGCLTRTGAAAEAVTLIESAPAEVRSRPDVDTGYVEALVKPERYADIVAHLESATLGKTDRRRYYKALALQKTGNAEAGVALLGDFDANTDPEVAAWWAEYHGALAHQALSAAVPAYTRELAAAVELEKTQAAEAEAALAASAETQPKPKVKKPPSPYIAASLVEARKSALSALTQYQKSLHFHRLADTAPQMSLLELGNACARAWISDPNTDKPIAYLALSLAGLGLANAGDAEGAVALLEELITQKKAVLRTVLTLGDLAERWQAQGDCPHAERAARLAVTYSPLLDGERKKQAGVQESTQPITFFGKAVGKFEVKRKGDLIPLTADYQTLLVDILGASKPEEAEAYCRELLDGGKPPQALPHLLMGRRSEQSGDLPGAEALYTRAVTEVPKEGQCFDVYQRLVAVRVARGASDDTLAACRQAADFGRNSESVFDPVWDKGGPMQMVSSYKVNLNTGKVSDIRYQTVNVAPVYTKAKEITVSGYAIPVAQDYFYLSECGAERLPPTEQNRGAQPYYTGPIYDYLLGRAAIRCGMTDQGLEYLARAVAALPANLEARLTYAEALLAANRPAEATEQLRAAQALAPEDSEIASRLRTMGTGQ